MYLHLFLVLTLSHFQLQISSQASLNVVQHYKHSKVKIQELLSVVVIALITVF